MEAPKNKNLRPKKRVAIPYGARTLKFGMSIHYKILGEPTCDNALFVQIDSGQSVESLLFDCGEDCTKSLSSAQRLAINHLLFSHLHMDHVAGFDSFFRCVYDRTSKPNHIWGPPGTARILQHRMQGFEWNLAAQMTGTWRVHELHSTAIQTTRLELREAFATAHSENDAPASPLLAGSHYRIDALTMDHNTPSLAYRLREDERVNVESSRLAQLDLRPGPWVKSLKDPTLSEIVIDGVQHEAAPLREKLITHTPGDSLAYLTDFLLNDVAQDRLAPFLNGCDTLICESQYRHADLDLAHKNFHMTSVQAATLAKRCNVRKLVLIHISERYEKNAWFDLLADARAIFSETYFPEHWPQQP